MKRSYYQKYVAQITLYHTTLWTLALPIFEVFKLISLWIFPRMKLSWYSCFTRIKISWYSCFMWDKLGWLNWFWSCSLCEGKTSLNTGLIFRKLWEFLFYRSPSSSAHLLMYLSLEISTFTKRIVWAILVELTELVNFQTTSPRWLNSLLGFMTVTLSVLLFWIYFFLESNNCFVKTFSPLGNSDHVAVSQF